MSDPIIIKLLNILFIASLCQMGVFVFFLLLNRRGNRRLNLILVFILVFTAIHYASVFFMFQQSYVKYWPLAHMVGNISFCVGPLLFLYLRKYLTNRFFHLKSDIPHFVLFALFLFLFVFFVISQRGNYSSRPVSIITPDYFILYNFFYLLLSSILIFRNSGVPDTERRPFFWPVFLFTGFAGLLFSSSALYFICIVCCPETAWTQMKALLFYTFGYASVLLYLVIFIIFSNTLVLLALRGAQIFRLNTKYKHSRLSSAEKIIYEKKIRTFMENDKPFLDPLLSLDKMAHSLGVSSKDLSQILNECFALNFADFINSFRIQEAITLFKNDTQNRTILDISLDAGFNAKSTFNFVFKKHTGVTPRDFIKNIITDQV